MKRWRADIGVLRRAAGCGLHCAVSAERAQLRMRGEPLRSPRGAAGTWSGDEGRRGTVAVLLALVLVAIIGFVSLGTEAVLLLLTSRHMQSAADAAALASVTARISGHPSDYSQEAFALTAAAGFVNNAPDGTTVTVNSPPATGNYTSATDAVEVLIAQPQTLALAKVVYSGPFTVRARSVAHRSGNGACALTLDTAASDSLSMNGTSVADFVGCDVSVNSTSATAVSLVGGAILNTNHLYDSGGYTLTGGSQINATGGITTRAAPAADPYAGYAMPAIGACLKNNYNPPASITISPGVYCGGITVRNGVALTLDPGIYIIDRGSFNLTGGASLSGAGVTVVLTSSTGGSYPTVSISGGATINLSAPSSGATAGLAFLQDRSAPIGGTNTFNGGAGQSITGVLYFPQQTVNFAGGTTSTVTCIEIIARELSLIGNATLKADCAGTGVLPIGGGQSVMVE